MLNKIISFSLKNKLAVGIFTLALVIYGVFELKKLPIDAVPDITDNQVQIITSSPSLGAPDIERFITIPLEQAHQNIAGIKQIRSFSRFGLSVITLVFHEDVNLFLARQQVAERLQNLTRDIPKEIGLPTMAPITTGLGEIYQYIIRPKKGYEHRYTTMELRSIQDWVVRKNLLSVEGVADVASFGGNLKQYQVSIKPTQLAAMGVSIQEVFTALQKNNQNTGGAYIEKGPTLLYIRSEGLMSSLDDIAQTLIKNTTDGTPILIKDVAKVEYGSAVRYGAMTYNGESEVAGAVVMMLKGANSNKVIQNVKTRMAEIQKSLPEGVKIDVFLDRTKMVNNSIGTVSKNLMEGALIVVFVLVLFLGNFRAGFLVASVIPLAMLFAIILMNLFGVSGNLMSLGALDFGLIVDGAVIIVEAVLHRLAFFQKKAVAKISQSEMDKEVENASYQMMNSAVFGQMIILIVYLPILSLQGIEGKMFRPMAQTVAFALLGAFLLSLTYIPVMSSLLLSKKMLFKNTFSDKMMQFLEEKYEQSLSFALLFPKRIISSVIVLFVVAIFAFTALGGEFIPSLPEGDFAVDTRVLSGSNLKTSTEAVLASQRILLKKFPEIIKIVGKTGSSEIPTDPMPMEASDMMIILKDKSEWTSAHTYDDLAELMTQELKKNLIGITYSFQYPVAMRFNELMTGARQDVVCKIYGENLDSLKHYAEKLGNLSKSIKGSQNIFVESISGVPQIIINYHRAEIAQHKMTIEGLNQIINTAFAGQVTGSVFEGEKKFDLVVRLEKDQRKNLDDVRNLLVSTPLGTEVPLSELAEVDIKNSVNQIQRENSQRRIIVGFNVRNRDVESTVSDLQKEVENKIKLPEGYFMTYGGTFENLQHAKARLSIAVPISLVLIFLMLYYAFHSMKYALLIFSAIPLSAIGGILALYLRDMPFSISAGVGFIALFGVAVLNGIVLVAEFNRQKLQIQDMKKVVILGGKQRLRPVLMTAFVASLGFLPMAISHSEGAEVQRPLASVVIGGLLLASFLTLYLLPILYVLIENKFKKS